jgi:hypothetical protein
VHTPDAGDGEQLCVHTLSAQQQKKAGALSASVSILERLFVCAERDGRLCRCVLFCWVAVLLGAVFASSLLALRSAVRLLLVAPSAGQPFLLGCVHVTSCGAF